MHEKAIIYVNSDHDNFQYLDEAVLSAISFKRFIPEARFILYTNNREFSHAVFDEIIIQEFVVPLALEKRNHKRGQMLVKQQAMIDASARRNLVLGSDTYALEPEVAEIFDLLDAFDIAAAHAPRRICRPIPDVPSPYPEYNCDVIAFRQCRKTKRFFKQWKKAYSEDRFGHPHDQGSFRYLSYHSNLRIATLPFEYNDRVGMFGVQASDEMRQNQRQILVQNRAMIPELSQSQCAKTSLKPDNE